MKKAIAVLIAVLSISSILGCMPTAHLITMISEKQLTTSPYCDDLPAYSPDGQRIAYRAFDSTLWYRHIWIMNKDGTNKAQLTFGAVVDDNPSFSLDGSKIYFARWGLRGDYTDLMVMNVDGTGITRLTYGPDGVMFSHPRVSPDNASILFGVNYGTSAGPYDFWVGVMDIDNTVYSLSDVQMLTRGADGIWVNDGQEILFSLYDWSCNRYGCGNIMIMNTDGTNIRQLTSGPFDGYPSMSQDNNRMVFFRASDPILTESDIYMADPDGSNPEPITLDHMRNSQPSFNPRPPEGTYEIVYTSYQRSGNPDIWSICIAKPTIPATIDIDPDTLNLKSNGRWVAAYVELPEGYNVADIDASTVLLNKTVAVDFSAPMTVGDYDGDGIQDLMVKFDRAQVISHILNNIAIEDKFTTVTLAVTGRFNDCTSFQGIDTIRVSHTGRGCFLENPLIIA